MPTLITAATRFCQFASMVEAHAKLTDDVLEDGTVIASFMGSGASDVLTIGDFRQLKAALDAEETAAPDLLKALKRAEDCAYALRIVINTQADDEGLWFVASTAPEGYLQQELRRLHAVIEGIEPNDAARAIIAKGVPA